MLGREKFKRKPKEDEGAVEAAERGGRGRVQRHHMINASPRLTRKMDLAKTSEYLRETGGTQRQVCATRNKKGEQEEGRSPANSEQGRCMGNDRFSKRAAAAKHTLLSLTFIYTSRFSITRQKIKRKKKIATQCKSLYAS